MIIPTMTQLPLDNDNLKPNAFSTTGTTRLAQHTLHSRELGSRAIGFCDVSILSILSLKAWPGFCVNDRVECRLSNGIPVRTSRGSRIGLSIDAAACLFCS